MLDIDTSAKLERISEKRSMSSPLRARGRKLTRPISPLLITKLMYGVRSYSCQGGRYVAHGGHSRSLSPRRSKSRGRNMTTPKGRRLFSSAKHGDRSYSRSGLPNDAGDYDQPNCSEARPKSRSRSRSRKLTIPKGPRLYTSDKYGARCYSINTSPPIQDLKRNRSRSLSPLRTSFKALPMPGMYGSKPTSSVREKKPFVSRQRTRSFSPVRLERRKFKALPMPGMYGSKHTSSSVREKRPIISRQRSRSFSPVRLERRLGFKALPLPTHYNRRSTSKQTTPESANKGIQAKQSQIKSPKGGKGTGRTVSTQTPQGRGSLYEEDTPTTERNQSLQTQTVSTQTPPGRDAFFDKDSPNNCSFRDLSMPKDVYKDHQSRTDLATQVSFDSIEIENCTTDVIENKDSSSQATNSTCEPSALHQNQPAIDNENNPDSDDSKASETNLTVVVNSTGSDVECAVSDFAIPGTQHQQGEPDVASVGVEMKENEEVTAEPAVTATIQQKQQQASTFSKRDVKNHVGTSVCDTATTVSLQSGETGFYSTRNDRQFFGEKDTKHLSDKDTVETDQPTNSITLPMHIDNARKSAKCYSHFDIASDDEMSTTSGASKFREGWSPFRLRTQGTPFHEVSATRTVRRPSITSFQRREHSPLPSNKDLEYDGDDDLSVIISRRQALCDSDTSSESIEPLNHLASSVKTSFVQKDSKKEYYDYLQKVIPDATNTIQFRDGWYRKINETPEISSGGRLKWRPAVPVGQYTFQSKIKRRK